MPACDATVASISLPLLDVGIADLLRISLGCASLSHQRRILGDLSAYPTMGRSKLKWALNLRDIVFLQLVCYHAVVFYLIGLSTVCIYR